MPRCLSGCHHRKGIAHALPSGNAVVGLRGDGPVAKNDQRPTLVAVGELLLWPQSVGDSAVTTVEAHDWPAFGLLVGERRDLLGSPARALFDLLDGVRQAAEPAVVTGRSRWTVVDPVRALLRLRFQAEHPVTFGVDILVPAERLLGLLPAVAHGAPIGVTTSRHARDLGGSVDVREVLRHVVLLRCPPVPGLAELADELIWSRPLGRHSAERSRHPGGRPRGR